MALAVAPAAEQEAWVVACPACGAEYEVDSSYLGDRVGCDSCNSDFVVTAPLPRQDDAPLMMPGATILGRYQIKQSWPGSIGPIYRVSHQQWHLDLIVKTVRPGYLRQPEDHEAYMTAVSDWLNLGQYPHLASCFDLRLVDGDPWLFIEYVNGGRLVDWISSGKLYHASREEVLVQLLELAYQVAAALAYAHEKGILHGSVSSHNVMMTKGGLAKLTDFGLCHARGLVEGAKGDPMALPPLAANPGSSIAYCSIEQFENETVTPQTDVWSWALVVLELFLGRRTWEVGAAGDEACLDYVHSPEAINGVRLPRDREVLIPPMPQELGDLLTQCFNRMPDDRPAGMAEVARRIGTILQAFTGHPPLSFTQENDLLLANTLNNRAVSCLDWGEEQQAMSIWEQALEVYPGHPEASYNLLTHRWRQGKLTDHNVLDLIGKDNPREAEQYRLQVMRSLIHMERGDARTAAEILDELTANRISTRGLRAALRRARLQLEETAAARADLMGHKAPVNMVMVSPDGRRVLTGSDDLAVRMFDAGTGRCVQTLSGHRTAIDALAWVPGGRLAISGSSRVDVEMRTPTLRLWDVTTGNCLGTFGDFNEAVYDLQVSADGRHLFCLAGDWQVHAWNLQAGAWTGHFRVHTGPGYRIAISPDGRHLYASGQEAGGELPDLAKWDLETTSCVTRYVAEEPTGGPCILANDGQLLVSARAGGAGRTKIHLWDTESGQLVGTFLGHPAPIRHFSLSADSVMLISIDVNGLMRQWEMSSGKCMRSFHETTTYSCSFISRTGRLPLAAVANNEMLIVQLLGQPHQQPPALSLTDYTLTNRPAVDRLAAYLSEIEEALELGRCEEACDMAEQVLAMEEYAGDYRFRSAKRRAGLRGRKTKLQGTRQVCSFPIECGGVFGIHFSENEEWVLAATSDGILSAWDIQTAEQQAEWRAPHDRLQFIVFSANGRHALSSHARGPVVLWDLVEGTALPRMQNLPSPGTAIAISPDGRIGVAGSSETAILIWDLLEDRKCNLLHAHNERVTTLDISPDSLYALSGSLDGRIKVWELESGRCIRISDPLGGPVRLARFSADGRSAVVGIDFSPLLIWDFVHNRRADKIGTKKTRPESVSLAADDQWLVAAERGTQSTRDQQLHIWQRSSEKPLADLEGLEGLPMFTAISADGSRVLACGSSKTVAVWELDWQYDFAEEPGWDDGAWAVLRSFLARHTPRAEDTPEGVLARRGQPVWTDNDFAQLMWRLGCSGHGKLEKDDVQQRLTNLASIWNRPKSSLG